VTVTGTSTILEAPPHPVQWDQICERIRSAGRILDIDKVAIDYLEGSASETILALDMNGLVERCIIATRTAQPLAAINLQSRRGQEMFSVVLATYDPQSGLAAARGFVIGITQQLEPVLVRAFKKTVKPGHNQEYWAFGETDYLDQQVIKGVGRQYLSAATSGFYTKRRSVRDVTIDEAEALALDLIQAAAHTTALVPPPSGIGGEIDVVLLGRDPRPKRLRWKSP
jgi:hypothetical protein